MTALPIANITADPREGPQPEPLLALRGLKTRIALRGGDFLPADDISLSVRRGETLAIVGESGSGKSITALSIMRILPKETAAIVGGEMIFDGRDLTQLSEADMREIRGRRMSMIFQEPMTSLNPVMRVGEQIVEVILRHTKRSRTEAWSHAVECLRQVGIPSPVERAKEFPHQLSGGMRQRVVIAIALACDPELIIADEPTTALDVTVQAQILDLFRALQKQRQLALVIITHDLGVVAEIADHVAVMYAGRVVERGTVEEIFDDPQHPYTVGLLSSIPSFGRIDGVFPSIGGTVPSLQRLPNGCRFHPRCPFAIEKCRQEEPPEIEIAAGHMSRCWRAPLE